MSSVLQNVTCGCKASGASQPARAHGSGAWRWLAKQANPTGFSPCSRISLGLLGLVALASASGCTESAKAESARSEAAEPKEAALHVSTSPAALRDVPVWLSLTGQLKGSRESDVAANAAGRVTKTLVERGETVKVGQALAIVDTRTAALQLKQARVGAESAEIAAENARTNCQRYRALAEKGAISPVELERVDYQCRSTELNVAAAEVQASIAGKMVGDGIIRAPFAGSVAERFVDVGEYVRPDSRVATLVDLSEMRLEFTIPEANVTAAQPGAKVRFRVAGYPEEEFGGTLKYVAAQVRATTRDLVAEAILDQADIRLRPGMFASVELAFGTTQQPVVAKSALLDRDGHSVVFVLVGGRLEERIVRVGERLGEEVALARGVAADENVVIEPDKDLENGQRVE